MAWPFAQNELAWPSSVLPAPSSAHSLYFSLLPRCHGTDPIGSSSLICRGHTSSATHGCLSSLPSHPLVSVYLEAFLLISAFPPKPRRALWTCERNTDCSISTIHQTAHGPDNHTSLQGDMYSYLAHTSDIVNNCMLNEAIKSSCVSTGPGGFLSRKEN